MEEKGRRGRKSGKYQERSWSLGPEEGFGGDASWKRPEGVKLSWDITAINFIQNFIEYPPLKVKYVYRGNYWEPSVWVST
jgi:hypothetical protein